MTTFQPNTTLNDWFPPVILRMNFVSMIKSPQIDLSLLIYHRGGEQPKLEHNVVISILSLARNNEGVQGIWRLLVSVAL